MLCEYNQGVTTEDRRLRTRQRHPPPSRRNGHLRLNFSPQARHDKSGDRADGTPLSDAPMGAPFAVNAHQTTYSARPAVQLVRSRATSCTASPRHASKAKSTCRDQVSRGCDATASHRLNTKYNAITPPTRSSAKAQPPIFPQKGTKGGALVAGPTDRPRPQPKVSSADSENFDGWHLATNVRDLQCFQVIARCVFFFRSWNTCTHRGCRTLVFRGGIKHNRMPAAYAA